MKNINVFYVLSIDDFFNIAKIIDNDFIGSEKSFTAERKKDYVYLTTNKCDDCSSVKIYCEPRSINISKIERLGSDTEGFQEIQNETYLKIENYIKSIIC
jgi:hypothetical protein